MSTQRASFAYVGDALDAAGLRLAGALVWSPAPGAEASALREARAVADLVLLTAEVAERLPRDELEAALQAARPFTVLLPEAGRPSAADPAERVRAQLGLERQAPA
jgi:vacuolar-type H+-ATPase subunit F/Vma7